MRVGRENQNSEESHIHCIKLELMETEITEFQISSFTTHHDVHKDPKSINFNRTLMTNLLSQSLLRCPILMLEIKFSNKKLFLFSVSIIIFWSLISKNRRRLQQQKTQTFRRCLAIFVKTITNRLASIVLTQAHQVESRLILQCDYW